MKIIHSSGFSHSERSAFRPTMLDNLLSSMKYVLTGMGRLRINLEDSNNKVNFILLEYVYCSSIVFICFIYFRNMPIKFYWAVAYSIFSFVLYPVLLLLYKLYGKIVASDWQLLEDMNMNWTIRHYSKLCWVWKFKSDMYWYYWLNFCGIYSLFDNMDRLLNEKYIPSPTDVLRARVRTTGIMETHFTIDDVIIRFLLFYVNCTI